MIGPELFTRRNYEDGTHFKSSVENTGTRLTKFTEFWNDEERALVDRFKNNFDRSLRL